MDRLYKMHDDYIGSVPMDYVRHFIDLIQWDCRLIAIKGAKGVGKSTLMQQYIKRNFAPGDRHVLYCVADTSYFASHSLIEMIETFVKSGGKYIFIDEIHKYENWSREIKEAYDLYRDLHIVISGSSLLKINDGKSDLSRRLVEYEMPGLSFREFLWFEKRINLEPIELSSLLNNPSEYCAKVLKECRPLEYFKKYLEYGYYPFYYEGSGVYFSKVENVVNYIIDVELTAGRSLEVGNTRKVRALLSVLSQLLPYQLDIAKISRNIGIERLTTLKYLKYLEEARLIRRLFINLSTTTDLQKPDKIYLDNTNQMYALSIVPPEIGTLRECFFCNQLSGAGHIIEYGGLKSGDFKIDGKYTIEVGGKDKDYDQIKDTDNAFIASDDLENPIFRKIPLWAFGCLY